MAREWRCVPWDLEADVPLLWADRWRALHNAEVRAQQPERTKIGELGTPVGGTTRQRIF